MLNAKKKQSADEKNMADVMAMMARDLARKNGSAQVSSAEIQRLASAHRLRPLLELQSNLQDDFSSYDDDDE